MFFIRHSFSRLGIGSSLQQSSQVSKFAITICSLPSLYYYSITTDSCCKCDTDDYKKKQVDIPLLLKYNTNVSTTSDKSILHHHQTSILASSPTAVSKPIKQKWRRFKWQNNNTKQQYDTSIIKKQSSWWNRIGKTFFVITRGIEITIRLCPLIVMTPTAMLVSRCFRESTWVSDISWRYTLHTLQCLGPAFVKLGQWAATRRDLFPLHMCIRLSELQDTARVHDWKYTHQSLCEAFGQDYESSGLVVSKDSILGSGSVGQVHRGTLQPNKRKVDVAIKVLHPNTKQLVQRDLALMTSIAEFIDKIPLNIVKMLSLPRAVSNFANVIERQVDLRVEGDNLKVFRHNFDCSDSNKRPQAITFPKPKPDWISEKVLVEEYAGDDAVPIAQYLSDDSQEGLKVRKKLAGPLLRGFLKMVFTDNFIHADLHPGNILVKATPTSKKSNPTECNYTIIFLDAGIATSLQPNDKANLRDLFKAVVLNDGYKAGKLMVERARYERCTEIPDGKNDFACGVADIVSEFHDRRKQGLTLGAVNVGSLLGQVLDLCRQFSVEIDPAMSSVVVSMLVLEGVGRSLDPDLNLIKAAIPFLIGMKS